VLQSAPCFKSTQYCVVSLKSQNKSVMEDVIFRKVIYYSKVAEVSTIGSRMIYSFYGNN
jgi:hypothetical protein